MNATELIDLHNKMKSDRSQFESHWRECAEYTYPQLSQGWEGGVVVGQIETSKRASLLDSTGTDATRTLASAFVGGMTPANAQWLSFSVGNGKPMDAVGHYLAECAELIWKNIHAANFDAEAFTSMLDFVITGQFVFFSDIDREKGGFMFEQWPTAECYFSSTTAGKVDQISREYQLTAVQAFTTFGEDVGYTVKEAMKSDPSKKFNFLHVIGPRKLYAAGGRTAKNMPFYSAYISMADKAIVRESGFEEFPCAVPRSTKIPKSAYATGVVSDALPDMKEINALKKLEKSACELAVSGMWIAEDDGVLNPRTIQVGPRKVIVANSVDSMKPLLSGSDFKVAFTTEDRLQAQIRRVMMADQLSLQGSSQMTATEVNERMNLLRQQMGPIYGRLQSEFLTPLVERCFMLMLRAGALPPPPDELSETDFHVKFDSPLARAQRLSESTAIQSVLGYVAQLQQTIPGIMDNIDTDAAVRELAATMGVPADIIRSSDDVAQGRAAQQQAQQAQQAGMMNDQLQMQNASEQITNANQVTGANAA